jgi:hypothetical protein
MSPSAVRGYLNCNGYLKAAETVRRLAEVLGESPARAAKWIAEAAAAHARSEEQRLAGLRKPKRMAECVQCGKEFTLGDGDEQYCSNTCRNLAHSKRTLNNPLKKRVGARIRNRRIDAAIASREMGLEYGRLQYWLYTPKAMLKRDGLAPIATWLGLSEEEAIRLQGGPGKKGGPRTPDLRERPIERN